MRRAVMFDLGDVLVKLRFDRGMARLRALCPTPERRDSIAGVYPHERSLAFNEGRIGPAEFLDWLASHVGAPDTPRAEVASAWCDIFDPWPEAEALAEEVIALGHPTYLMSNTDPLHFGLIRERFVPVLSRFDGLHLSYEAGRIKPDPRFYTSALERWSLDPSRCCFLDDREDNVAAARAVGIPTLLHRGDVAEARAFLREQGVAVRAQYGLSL